MSISPRSGSRGLITFGTVISSEILFENEPIIHNFIVSYLRVFSDISEWNNDYSDTFDFQKGVSGGGRVVTFFILKGPDYKFAMLIHLYIYV